jgi:hypothetical protein
MWIAYIIVALGELTCCYEHGNRFSGAHKMWEFVTSLETVSFSGKSASCSYNLGKGHTFFSSIIYQFSRMYW